MGLILIILTYRKEIGRRVHMCVLNRRTFLYLSTDCDTSKIHLKVSVRSLKSKNKITNEFARFMHKDVDGFN